MLPIFWEDETSLYYVISTVLFAIATIIFTYLWSTKTKKVDTNNCPTPEPTPDAVRFMRDPILLAKELEEKFPKEVKMLEKKVKNEQLEAIYKLMQKHSDQFGNTTMDDMKNQMQLYGF